MDQTSSKVRLAAIAATFIALLVVSVPFVWERGIVADNDSETLSGALPPAAEPVASHDDSPAGAGVEPAANTNADADADTGACMADAKAAPLDYTLPDIDGNDVTLSDFKGKVILLNFWATWCGPCKAEIPGFVELQEKYKDDLVVLGFSVDDPAEKAKAFATEYKVNYPMVLGLGRDEVQDAYGPIWGIPTSFLISRDAKVCKKHMGIAPKAVFEKEIQALLAL